MGSHSIDIVDCGAVSGRLCTAAIQMAIDTMAEGGGGTVLLPEGTWISGTVFVKSGVTLHLTPGAVLKGSGNLDDYVPGATGHNRDRDRYHLLVMADQENIVVTGGGCIDGTGEAFWIEPAATSTYPWFRAKRPRVSPMVEVSHCRNVTFDNVRIVNSPGWTVHLFCCDRVIMRGVSVENNLYGPNTDGFDINGCRDVFVSDCRLVCGDDAIILKATRDARSCERIMITNCSVETNCIGIGLGQETLSDIRDVTVSNCVATGCHRMISIGMWEGGTIEDVTVTGIVGDTFTRDNITLARPIHIDIKQHAVAGGEHCTLRNVQISNVVARTKGRVMLTAQDGMVLENVLLRDIRLYFPDTEDPVEFDPKDGATGSSQYSNRNLEARRQRAAFVVENARELILDGLYVTWPAVTDCTVPFAGIWARRVDGGLFDAPLLNGFGEGAQRAELTDCRWIVR